MYLSFKHGQSVGLFLVIFAAVLASGVRAAVLPSSVWSSLKWPTVSSMYELPLRFFQNKQIDYASHDFWDLTRKLGGSVQQYTDTLLHDAAIANAAAAGKLYDFKVTMAQVVSSTMELRAEVQAAAEARGLTLENVSEGLSTELAAVLEELKAEFPAPNDAENHEQRVEIVSRALEKVERSVVSVSVQSGVSEADARAHFKVIQPHVQHVLVITGDLAEQHPILLETILFSGAILLVPEIWFLRPILSIFGFGPYGPVKRSSAAWAQRRFWGAAVARRSWFARLQSAGMKYPKLPPGTGRKVVGSIGVGLGIVGSLFKGCR